MLRSLSRLSLVALAVVATFSAGHVTAEAQAPSYLYTVDTDTALDNQTNLRWQRVPLQQYNLSFQSALLGCQNLNLGGYASGWRLPTVREMLSIVDARQASGPQWDRTVFTGAPLSSYWTSTTVASDPTKAWIFTFTPGIYMEQRVTATDSALVRCVH